MLTRLQALTILMQELLELQSRCPFSFWVRFPHLVKQSAVRAVLTCSLSWVFFSLWTFPAAGPCRSQMRDTEEVPPIFEIYPSKVFEDKLFFFSFPIWLLSPDLHLQFGNNVILFLYHKEIFDSWGQNLCLSQLWAFTDHHKKCFLFLSSLVFERKLWRDLRAYCGFDSENKKERSSTANHALFSVTSIQHNWTWNFSDSDTYKAMQPVMLVDQMP